MPYLQVITNVKLDDPKQFVLDFSKVSAQALGKPESLMSVSYTYNETLSFAGTFEPAFQAQLISLGNLTTEENKSYSKVFSEFITERLKAPANRGYIAFVDPGWENIGYNGTTFAK